MTTHSTTPGYVGGLVTGHIRPAVTPKDDEDALLIDNLMRAALAGDNDRIDAARMALRQRFNDLRNDGVPPVEAPSLTDDDIDRIQEECDCPGCDSCDIRIHEFARAVEAHVRGAAPVDAVAVLDAAMLKAPDQPVTRVRLEDAAGAVACPAPDAESHALALLRLSEQYHQAAPQLRETALFLLRNAGVAPVEGKSNG